MTSIYGLSISLPTNPENDGTTMHVATKDSKNVDKGNCSNTKKKENWALH